MKDEPRQILLALFLDFDIQQDEGVQPEIAVLLDSIVK